MGLDINAIRARLSALQGQNKRREFQFKPVKGRNNVRIVPSAHNKNTPFTELYFHYLGNKTYLSPLSYGRRDPIAEFADKLRATGNREDWIQAKTFTPKMRTVVPVIVRGQEAEGVKLWSIGKTVYTEILSIINDPDYGDITDPTTGRDLVVEYTEAKDSDTGFAKSVSRAKPNQSPITGDAELLEKILTEQPRISDMYEEPTFEALKSALDAYLNPDDLPTPAPRVSVVEKDEEIAPAAVAAPAKKSASKAAEVTKSFEELFNEK